VIKGIFGVSPSTAKKAVWRILGYIYLNSTYCQRMRNLSVPQNMNEILNECHNDLVNHETFYPLVQHMMTALGFVNDDLIPVILIHDTRDIKHHKITDLQKQKSTYSTKSKMNAIKKIQISSIGGRAKFIHVLHNTISPRNSDERIMKNLIDLETVGGVTGGMKAMLEETPGYWKWHIFDRGYEKFQVAAGQSFFSWMDQLRIRSRNRVIYSYPNSPGKSFMDLNGASVPAPIIPGQMMTELQCNYSEMTCTLVRGAVEQSFLPDYRFKICGVRSPITYQYLNAWNGNPTPQAPRIYVILMAVATLEDMCGVPFRLKFDLPPGYTYRQVGLDLMRRCEKLNWLDKFRVGQNFGMVRDPFLPATQIQLQNGAQGNLGNLRLVNGMRPALTRFPRLTDENITEVAGGSFGPRSTPSYITGIRELQMSRGPYVNLQQHVQGVKAVITRKQVQIFDQVNPPRGWFGPWNVNNLAWTPCHVVRVDGIPSMHSSGKVYTVVVAYALHGTASPNPFGFSCPELGRILMFCCGPRNGTSCRSGPRTMTPCVHVLSVLRLLGVIAHNPNAHRFRYHDLHAMDAGDPLPIQHQFDLVQGHFN